jgi:hypothetical protein
MNYGTRTMKSSKVIALAAVLTAATLVLAVAATTIAMTQSAFASNHNGNTVTIQRNIQHKSVSGSGNTVHQEHRNVIITGGGGCSGCG